MDVQRRTHSHSLGIRESRSPTNERPRSRAIRIERNLKDNVNSEDLEEIHRSSGDGMYDWATWQMYNRIIDHRQKYPVTLNEDTTSEAAQTSQFASALWNLSSDDANLACEAAYPLPTQHSDYSQEVEVFEFDP